MGSSKGGPQPTKVAFGAGSTQGNRKTWNDRTSEHSRSPQKTAPKQTRKMEQEIEMTEEEKRE